MALDPERYQGLAGFRWAMRRFLADSEAISRDAGVTQQQYQALLVLKAWPDGDPMTIKALAEQLLLTHHAAVQLVDRLAKAGLAARAVSGGDRRKVALALTPAGERLMDRLAGRHLSALLQHEPLITKALQQLRRLGPDAAS